MRLPPRDIIRHPGAVVILPFVDDESICLIKNFRLTLAKQLLELPAGTCTPGEDPSHTAKRELTEETGFAASDWEFLQTFYMSPGILDEAMHVYVARGLTPGKQNLEADEQIENQIISVAELERMIRAGEIIDGKTIAAYALWKARQ